MSRDKTAKPAAHPGSAAQTYPRTGVTVVALGDQIDPNALAAERRAAGQTLDRGELIGLTEQDYVAALSMIAAQEASALEAHTVSEAQRSRVIRAAAAVRAAEVAAAEVDRTAAAVRETVAATALRMARSAAADAALARNSVVLGEEAAAAEEAARIAGVVTMAALATAEEAVLAARLVARAATAAAAQVALVAAAAETERRDAGAGQNTSGALEV